MPLLAGLATHRRFDRGVLPEMLRHVEQARINQLPTCAERAAPVLRPGYRASLAQIIDARIEIEGQPAKRKRMDMLLRKLSAPYDWIANS